MKKYSLQHKKTSKLVRYHYWYNVITQSDRDFCCDTQYVLDDYSDKEWLVDNPVIAAYAKINNEKWYNADYETPSHSSSFKPEEWDVVEVIRQVKKVDIELPSYETMAEIFYGEKGKYPNPGHKERILKNKPNFSVYDYCMVIDDLKKGK